MPETGNKIYVQDIREGQEVAAAFVLSDLRLATTKNGRPYVALKLRDRTGGIEARVWDRAEEFARKFRNGEAALIRGLAESFQGSLQIKVVEARPLAEDEIVPADFLPSTPHDVEVMFDELKSMAAGLGDPDLRSLLSDVLADEELAAGFKQAPAAKKFHHAYRGGLLEHTLSLARAASAAAGLYPRLDRDLLLAGAILHDLGKIREFNLGLTSDYSPEGRLVGHLIIGVETLDRFLADRPEFPAELALMLKHLILSHHGEYELGSPKKPKFLEALALHHLDDLDAKMNGIATFIDRHADERTGWTDYNNLMGRYFFRPGWRGETPGEEAPDEARFGAPVESSSIEEQTAVEAAAEIEPPARPRTRRRAEAETTEPARPSAAQDSSQLSLLED
ncbi:MAG: HD domain-containing protein [Thermodesulfobacteriota bacterium]